MKRAPFLGATAAVVLNPASVYGATRAVRRPPARRALRLVPAVAEPIPATVLANPILGEARRFDGTVAPRGWAIAQGQLLAIAANRPLFAIFGTRFGGDGRTTFALPAPPFGVLVAVTGLFPTRANVFAQAGRSTNIRALLGPGAVPGTPRVPKPLPPDVIQARALAARALHAPAVAPVPVPRALVERIESSARDARSQALDALGAESRERLRVAIADAVAGHETVYGVVTRMTAALSDAEADRLLAVNDTRTRAFNARAGVQVHAARKREAAHFLASVAIDRAQARAIDRYENQRAR